MRAPAATAGTWPAPWWVEYDLRELPSRRKWQLLEVLPVCSVADCDDPPVVCWVRAAPTGTLVKSACRRHAARVAPDRAARPPATPAPSWVLESLWTRPAARRPPRPR